LFEDALEALQAYPVLEAIDRRLARSSFALEASAKLGRRFKSLARPLSDSLLNGMRIKAFSIGLNG
jgi:hypothetical protein